MRRVGLDYHVEVEGHYYSVPYRSIARDEVEVRLTDRTIEIFPGVSGSPCHRGRAGNSRHTTIPEHMPCAHRRYAEWTPATLSAEARQDRPGNRGALSKRS